MGSKIDGVMWAIEKLRELQNKFNHTSIWNHSATSKFAPVELSDYLILEFRKIKKGEQMKDMYGKDVRVGDVVTVKGTFNPNKWDKGIWKISKITTTIGNRSCLYVEGIDTFLYSDMVELYAKKVED